jgi:osmotically-inducible protein OsmY
MSRNNKRNLFILTLGGLLGITHVPQTLALSDETIKQRIEETASNTSELRGTKVGVAVEDSYVVLYGEVRLYIQKMTYERIAWQTMGVVEVDNEIRVVPVVPVADTAIERKIREILRTYRRFHGAQVKIRVKEGSVFIRGTLEHPRDILFFKHQVAEIEGVIAIEIEAAFRV